jgi:uncharacterized protein YbjT (DUF2867 family)
VDVVVFGATGMVGQGVLRECLVDPEVTRVLVVGRSPTGQQHPKLREIRHTDFLDFAPIADELTGLDACFFCLGVSSVGLSEDRYRQVTYDMTMAAATVLAERNPAMTFVYVTGAGTDSTERGRTMWARVKGRTENALLALPFQAYMFRPGYIQPRHGVRSRNGWLRLAYTIGVPLYPILSRLFPAAVTTTDQIGRAMIAVARHGAPTRILGSREITAAATAP